MKALVIVNDGPLQGQRCFTGLDLAGAMLRTDGTEVSVFLVGAAAACTIAGSTGGGPTEDAARADPADHHRCGCPGLCCQPV